MTAWDEDDDRPVEPLPGGPPSTSEDGGLAELLLTTTLALHHASILLREATEAEWRAVEPRLAAMRAAWGGVPGAPTPEKRVGFRWNGKNGRVVSDEEIKTWWKKGKRKR